MAIPRIPQDALIPWTIGTSANPTVTNTAGKTVSARVRALGSTDTPTELGSASGAAAGTAVTINLDTSLVEPGLYELEAVADVGETNPVTLIPNETVGIPYVIEVFDVAVTV